MKHPTANELFKYWDQLRGRHMAPDRNDVDPGAIRRILADTFLLGIDGGMGHPYRLAGTRVCAIFGRELKAEPFVSMWDRPSRPLVRDMFNVIVTEAIGVSAGVTGHAADGQSFELELLVLPLRHEGRLDSRAIGVLAPSAPPYWLGIHPVTRVTLGALRYVGGTEPLTELPARATANSSPAASSLTLTVGGKIRRGLRVYEGGREE
jgi:hypothetical protein